MFLTKKLPRIYVGLYQKFLYKSSIITDTSSPEHSSHPPPRWDGGCIWSKENSITYSSRSCSHMQWSVNISQMHWQRSDWTISLWHIKPKLHAAAFHTKQFSSLTWPFPGRPSIVPRGSLSFGGRGQMKAYFTNSLPLLLKISIIRPPHHLPQGTILRLVFSAPPIGQNTLHLSVIRGWRLIMTWNQPPIMFLWSKLLLTINFLRDGHGGGMESIVVMWYQRIRMSLTSKISVAPKAFPTSSYSYTVSLSNSW